MGEATPSQGDTRQSTEKARPGGRTDVVSMRSGRHDRQDQERRQSVVRRKRSKTPPSVSFNPAKNWKAGE